MADVFHKPCVGEGDCIAGGDLSVKYRVEGTAWFGVFLTDDGKLDEKDLSMGGDLLNGADLSFELLGRFKCETCNKEFDAIFDKDGALLDEFLAFEEGEGEDR